MPDPGTLAAALVLALVPSLLYLLVLNWVDRYEKEPWTILFACLALGGIAAPVVAIAVLAPWRGIGLDPQFAPGPGGGADPLAALVQELAKGGALLLLVRTVRDELDDVLDGIIYGAAIGAGFGAAETFAYAAGGTHGLSTETLAALLVAGLDHAFYTAAFGAVLGAAVHLADRRWTAVYAVYGLATAVLLHALHDGIPVILGRLLGRPDAALGIGTRLVAQAVNWVGIVVLAFVVVWAWRRAARVLRSELRDEVAGGVVSEADYASITSWRARIARQLAALREGGLARAMAVRRLYATEGELAFEKWRGVVRRQRRHSRDRSDELRAEVLRLRRSTEGSE